MTRRLTRRGALAEMGVGAVALWLGACGSSGSPVAAGGGSTLRRTWGDPAGDGMLSIGPGVGLVDRTELAPRAAVRRELARVAHLTDAHVLDAQSPARVTFLDRLGAPYASTFRPQEALTAAVLAGAVRAVNAFGPQAVIQGGDLIDNAQSDELAQALRVLGGGRVGPASGAGGYVGVQSAANADPFYYRPDVDAPRHPGLLAAAQAPFASPGLRVPWYPVAGDHDLLVAGVLPPTPATRAIALGDRAVWALPRHLRVPRGFSASVGQSPDGLANPAIINRLIGELLHQSSVSVPADPARRQLDVGEALDRLRSGSGRGGGSGPLLDYAFDVSRRVRLIVLDLVRRDGGSGGLVHPGQPAWLSGQLRAAGDRWVLVFSHQPLDTSEGGPQLLALLDRHPRMLAALWGHTHRNRIVARPAPNGGYWLIATASLIDFPQQARALRVLETAGGGAALETWMLDHVSDGRSLGEVARSLAYLDAQGGRPQGFAGAAVDRNVRLFRGAPGGV